MQSSFSAIAHTSRDHDVLGKFRPLHYQALLSTPCFLPTDQTWSFWWLTIPWTDDRWMFSCSAIFLVLLLVPGWFSCEKISSPNCSIISGVRTYLGRPMPGFLVRDDHVSSTHLQISLTVSSFQFFSGYFAEITRYPSPCSRSLDSHFIVHGNLTHDSSNQFLKY